MCSDKPDYYIRVKDGALKSGLYIEMLLWTDGIDNYSFIFLFKIPYYMCIYI